MMEPLAGLPDFGFPLSTSSSALFATYGATSFAVLPQLLTIAHDAQGNPEFSLKLVERLGDPSASGEYSVVDFSLSGDFALDDALVAARALNAQATVQPIAIDGGFARLYPTTGMVAPSSDVLLPVRLGMSGSSYARWTTRLSADAGELIKGAIAGGALLLGARVEYYVRGVAARSQSIVEFEPTALLEVLVGASPTRMITELDLLAAFASLQLAAPLKVTGTADGDFPRAVADRIVAAYGSLAPAPGVQDPPYVRFDEASTLPQGSVSWDLSEPASGTRQWVLLLDLLTELRAIAAKSGIGSLVNDVAIPPLQIGFCDIDVDANLPANRSGIAAIGATVTVAPNPPMRPSSISETLAFSSPDDSGSVQFRLSPNEEPAYTVAGFAVVVAAGTVKEYAMPPQTRNDRWLQLEADDFPVRFARITVADRLTSLATISAALTYTIAGEPTVLTATLVAQNPDVAFAVPSDAFTTSLLKLVATPLDGSTALTLAPVAPGRIQLDVSAFPEYGPHRIPISATLRNGEPPLVLDLVAEEQSDASPDQIFLTADLPSATWGYVATSPFHAGYRYRTAATGGKSAGSWSPLLSPFAPLVLDALTV